MQRLMTRAWVEIDLGALVRNGERFARAAGVPVLSEVEGLFAWTRPGDLLVVDADTGTLRVNPAASAVEHMRSAREK